MKKIIAFFILLIATLSSAAQNIDLSSSVQEIDLVFEGVQPKEKKYFFEIKKPENLDISKYQYMIWKTLKDNGYELTDSVNANIAIRVNYMAIEKDAQTTERVKIGEKTETILGQEISYGVYTQKKSDHYKETHYILDLKAQKKGANANSLPIWHIYSPENSSDVSKNLIVLIKFLWFNNGVFRSVLKEGKNNSYKKVKINKEKLSEDKLSLLNKINIDFTRMNDAEEYNNQINN